MKNETSAIAVTWETANCVCFMTCVLAFTVALFGSAEKPACYFCKYIQHEQTEQGTRQADFLCLLTLYKLELSYCLAQGNVLAAVFTTFVVEHKIGSKIKNIQTKQGKKRNKILRCDM